MFMFMFLFLFMCMFIMIFRSVSLSVCITISKACLDISISISNYIFFYTSISVFIQNLYVYLDLYLYLYALTIANLTCGLGECVDPNGGAAIPACNCSINEAVLHLCKHSSSSAGDIVFSRCTVEDVVETASSALYLQVSS